jgi:predicted PurR-regulated permease PerM
VRGALSPFLVALLVSVVVDPLIRLLESKGWPRRRSVPLLFILLTLIWVGLMVWGLPILYNQVTGVLSESPKYLAQIQNYTNTLLKSNVFKRFPPTFRAPLAEQVSHTTTRAAEYVPVLLTNVTALFGATVSRILWFIITLLATFYLMLDLPLIGYAFLRGVPPPHRKRAHLIASEVAEVFSNYLRGLIIVCSLYGAAVAIALTPFGINSPLVIGLMAGALYMVPYAGAILTTFVVGVIAFVSFGVSRALVVVAVLTVIHTLFDYGITPRILGKQVGLHPLASLFAMVTAGALFGITGIILAVPVAASIVVLLKNLYPRLMRPLPPEASLTEVTIKATTGPQPPEMTPS